MTEVATRPAPTGFAAARKAMLDSQLRTSGVNEDFVLRRMGAVAREDFVPESARSAAYVDRAIPLGDGRWLPAPLVQGSMLAEAAPNGTEKALIVDGGSGYLPELLRPLVASLEVMSPEEALGKSRKGDFDLVMVDGAVEHVPDTLAKRLADGGLLVTGVVDRGVTRVAIGRKAGKGVALLPVKELGIPRLVEFDRPKGWSF